MRKNLIKRNIRKGARFYRKATRHLRVLPDFIIIGAQKCGTTSLYDDLIKHPSILPSFTKEVDFFNKKFHKGVEWYRAHFPSVVYKYCITHIYKQDFITGEASPDYIIYPHSPKRISTVLPGVKIIVLLRNPVDRAYSHYYHEIRQKRETLSFEDAIGMEEERLRGEFEKMTNDENYYSFNYNTYSYLSRGIYIEQLKRWSNYFNKEQILILKSEDFFEDSQAVFQRTLQFLNLPSWQPEYFGKDNVGYYPKMEASTRCRLLNYFESYNYRLYEYLGVNFGWEK